MKHRLTALFLAFALLFSLLPAAVLTANATVYSGTCGAEGDGSNLTWTLDTETGVLEISGTGEMTGFLIEEAPWHAFSSSLITASIAYGVKSIGARAFKGCTEMKSVTFPNSLKIINYEAFSGCTGLTGMTIPESVQRIESYAFIDCSALTSVTIPKSVQVISAGAFASCTELTEIIMDSDNPSFSCMDGVVYNKDKSKLQFCAAGKTGAFAIPGSVTSIYHSAFYGCTGLTSLLIPDSVKSIDEEAFNACSGLTSLTIPDSVTSIRQTAFRDCTGLAEILVNSGNPTYCSVDGVLYNKDKTELMVFPAGKTDSVFAIPDSVTSIGADAFWECTGLTNVTIPVSVTTINANAFVGCVGLTSITIPGSVTSIGNYAFSGCNSLLSVTVCDGVTSIGRGAFHNCTGLTSVMIPGSVTSIGKMAFGYYWDDETNEYIKVDGFTISGYQDSAAQAYAEENEFTFIALGEVPVGTGDLNGDGDVDTIDSIRLAKFLVDLVELTDEQKQAADINGDGDVTALDGIRLAKFLVGLVETLRPEPEKAALRAAAH